MITLPPKRPAEVLDYAVDFTDELDAGDSLTSYTAAIVGATKDSDARSGAVVTVTVSGGTLGTLILITVTVVTLAGRTLQRLLVVPYAEPISLDQAKAHLRVELDDTDEDELIAGYIVAAREYVEEETGLVLVRRTIVEHHKQFWDCRSRATDPRAAQRALCLRAWPVNAVSEVAYTDCNGDAQTLADTRAVTGSRPAKLWPPRNTCWPAISEAEGVDVTLDAGFDDFNVPRLAVQAMLLLIGHWYMHRESVVAGERGVAVTVPQSAEDIIDKLRLTRV